VSDSPEDRKAQSREFWDRMASQWEARRELNARSTSNVSGWLVDAIDPQPGHTILDLAAGVGETGFAVAARLGADGRVISSDFSPEMVRASERGAEDLGIDNVEFRVLDAENLELADGSVDGVTCRFGLMLFPDPRRAASEIRRVLRPGGRFACSTWGPPDRNQWMTTSARLMIERGYMEPFASDGGGPGMFAMPDGETIEPLLKEAGFESVRTETMDVAWRFETGDEYWSFVSTLQGPVAAAISELDDEQKLRVRGEVEERAGQFASNGGYALPGLSVNTVAS
jgi:ubiquinone/menaquinone biosynthesis C-methylase UbiE